MKAPRVFILTVFLLSASLMLTGCDTGGNDGGGGGSAGTKTINVSGGDGDTGTGGDAGGLLIDSYANVTVKKSGSANASFSTPAFYPEYTSCASEFVPLSSVTVAAYDSGDTLSAAGAAYLISGDNRLRIDNNNDTKAEMSDDTVECIDIPQNVTVTFGLNWDANDADSDTVHATGADQFNIFVTSDIRVAGTMKVAMLNSATAPDTSNTDGYDSGSTFLSFQNIFITSTGTIDTSGRDNAAGNGGHGGFIELYAENGNGYSMALMEGRIDCSGGNATGLTGDGGIGCAYQDGAGLFEVNGIDSGLYVWSNSRIVNKGSVHTHGGNGENGGDAGEIQFDGTSHVYHTGTLHASGGNGSTGIGGNGTWVGMDTDLGSLFISGDITARGGNGDSGGGSGANMDLWSAGGNNSTDMLISGDIDISGGDATTSGDGGTGGYVLADASGGDIVISGNISAGGGDGTGGTGGSAQSIDLLTSPGYDEGWGNALPSGAIEVSGNLDVSGGDGDTGGAGGAINISHADYEVDVSPGALDITLYGYSDIRGDGGTSQSGNGGNAGYVEIYTTNTSTLSVDRPAGSITTEPNISLTGGIGNTTVSSGGTGGQGGYVYIYTDSTFNDTEQPNTVMNTGNIDLSAGAGDIGGSNSSSTFVEMYAYGQTKNTGRITMDSGDGLTDGGYSSAGLSIISSRDVVNTGGVSSNGGNGDAGDGGDASSVYLAMFAGRNIKNMGGIDARGGNGDPTTGTGGDGGMIDMLSQQTTTINSASLSVAGGSANTDGSNGIIWFDWNDITPKDGTL